MLHSYASSWWLLLVFWLLVFVLFAIELAHTQEKVLTFYVNRVLITFPRDRINVRLFLSISSSMRQITSQASRLTPSRSNRNGFYPSARVADSTLCLSASCLMNAISDGRINTSAWSKAFCCVNNQRRSRTLPSCRRYLYDKLFSRQKMRAREAKQRKEI